MVPSYVFEKCYMYALLWVNAFIWSWYVFVACICLIYDWRAYFDPMGPKAHLSSWMFSLFDLSYGGAENRSTRGPVDGRSWLWWVIDNVVWTDSWLSIAGTWCGLICIGAGEEWVRKGYALRGLWRVERQVGLTRGTRWPAGSSAGHMVARKARRSRRSEPVQGSGSQPESARGVCGGSPENCWWLSHKTKTGGSVSGDGIRTRGGIAGLALGGRGLQRRRGRAIKRSATWPISPVGLYLNLSARSSVVFCLARRGLIYISSRVSRKTIHPDCFSFRCSLGLHFSSVCKESDLRVNGSFHGCVDSRFVARWIFVSFTSYFRRFFVCGLFLRFWGVWARICWWESWIVAPCIFMLDLDPQTSSSAFDWRISIGNLALFLSSVESRFLLVHWVWGYKIVGIASPRGASPSPMIW
jgi:hypothetical protein